ncbi:MAG: alpha/beta hydrolase [Christensenella sp.]|nr:alpha/beta hydrolase [Christensenella sp.]
MKKRFDRRWWLIALAALLALLVAIMTVWSCSPAFRERIITLGSIGGADAAANWRMAALASVVQRGKNISYGSRFQNGEMDLYAAKSVSKQPLIVYAHGGYYLMGDKRELAPYCRMLASYGYVVANINYMLAPDGRYPTQILQMNEAIAYLIDHADEYGIDTARVFLAGDSAGAHLSSQMGLYYTNPAFREETGGIPAITKEQLLGVALHCGYYNMDTVRATGFPMIAKSIALLTGEREFEGTPAGRRMNTVAQITPDYPAVFIDCGDQDPFLTQAEEMIDALTANGVEVASYLPASGETSLGHEFQMMLNTPEGAKALELLAGFLRERVNKGG